MKNLIKQIIFKIRIWNPPDWFINPFFSPSLYAEYIFRNVGKDFVRGFNETIAALQKESADEYGVEIEGRKK